MPLIEGIGDEVTIFFVIITFLFVLALAWFSTNIRDIPFFSLIIIELSQRRRRRSGQTQGQSESTNQSSETPVTSSVETNNSNATDGVVSPQESGEETGSTKDSDNLSARVSNKRLESENLKSSDADSNSSTESNEVIEPVAIETEQEVGDIPIIPQSDDSNLSETELRRRRVAFFEHKSSASDSSENERENDSNSCKCDVVETVSQQGADSSLSQEDRLLQDVVLQDNEKLIKSETTVGSVSEQSNSVEVVPSVEEQVETSAQSSESFDENQIRIRLKYLNDSQRQVTALPTQTIGEFRRDNFASELENNKLVRFIFNGQDLRNDSNTLQAYNIVDNSVVHCLISQVDRQANQQGRHEADDGFDIGNLMLPMFGFMICVVWYLRFEYRQFFSGSATISLIGVTFLYIAAILASWENHRRGHAHEHVD